MAGPDPSARPSMSSPEVQDMYPLLYEASVALRTNPKDSELRAYIRNEFAGRPRPGCMPPSPTRPCGCVRASGGESAAGSRTVGPGAPHRYRRLRARRTGVQARDTLSSFRMVSSSQSDRWNTSQSRNRCWQRRACENLLRSSLLHSHTTWTCKESSIRQAPGRLESSRPPSPFSLDGRVHDFTCSRGSPGRLDARGVPTVHRSQLPNQGEFP